MLLALLLLSATWQANSEELAAPRPNILWITSEDNGPHLGCYGDSDANTPNLDALAQRGLRFDIAWSNAPVCAPARTTIITGMYATSLGAHHMRSRTKMPSGMGMFPQLMRAAGYYCSNRSKTDYNVETQGQVWDQSSKNASWRGRAKGQPFFSVFNFTTTHESATRRRPHQAVHDPAKISLPSYYPDLPEIRQDWAQYHDQMTVMDRQVGKVLKQLKDDGLAESTIVFYFADHGAGFPRAKRWPGNSGLQVPFIVHVPEKFRHLAPENYAPGVATSELVAFVDLAPTVLSTAGISPPRHYQGRAFAGKHMQKAPDFLYGFRGRMDERMDMSRSVRDQRYAYMRNYYPRLPHGQHVAYMFQTPTTKAWKAAFDAGELDPKHAQFWNPRAEEELYDLHIDPDETMNLASSPEHRSALLRLRLANQKHLLAIQDLGFLPEAEMHQRAGNDAPRTLGLNHERYPMQKIMAAADSFFTPSDATPLTMDQLTDPKIDSALRYWFLQKLLNKKEPLPDEIAQEVKILMSDSSASVRIAAAEVIAILAPSSFRNFARNLLLEMADHSTHPFFISVQALNSMGRIESWSSDQIGRMSALPVEFEDVPRALRSYLPRLKDDFLGRKLILK